MQLALLHSEVDYLTYNWTSRHGTGYTFTWPRPTVEPVWKLALSEISRQLPVRVHAAGIMGPARGPAACMNHQLTVTTQV